MSKLIVANWKSHKTATQVHEWFEAIALLTKNWNEDAVQVVVAPAFPLLAAVDQAVDELEFPIEVGVQDLSPFPPGSYTGAVVAENFEEFGVKFAIIGHSERRRYFHETHTDVANKVERAIDAGLTPIVCVDDEYSEEQAAAISPDLVSQCVVAYEPLEAIGSGLSQSVAEVKPVVESLRTLFPGAQIIYGGSVSSENVADYMAVCDGALVGTKSLTAEDFAAVVSKAV